MSCNKCKKKTVEPEKVITDMAANSFELRDGISYDKLEISEPSDSKIIEFLKVNPNRLSLFKIFPFNWNNKKERSDEN